MKSLSTIVVTAGEPASIAPDICIAIAQLEWQAKLVFLCNPNLIRQRANILGTNIQIDEIKSIDEVAEHKKGLMTILPLLLNQPCVAGELDIKNAKYVLNSIQQATWFCLNNQADAMLTPPVHKGIINQSGYNFTGHTEFIADICQATPVMMLASKEMRVALATTHLPLKDVSEHISQQSLEEIISIIHHDLISKFAIKTPHILVCGLNPHAGEDGHLGMEEIEVIKPVLDRLNKQGMNLTGPLPADSLFNKQRLKQADAVLAMYHDQGLPVLKYSSFGEGINITLGLPIIRVSVDHGTALEIAASGKANIGSMIEATKLALELADLNLEK